MNLVRTVSIKITTNFNTRSIHHNILVNIDFEKTETMIDAYLNLIATKKTIDEWLTLSGIGFHDYSVVYLSSLNFNGILLRYPGIIYIRNSDSGKIFKTIR